MKEIKINDIKSLAHTQWNCKYHVVFAPKYRRKVFYECKRLEIGQILRQLCEWCNDNRSGSMSRPHTYVNRNLAKI